MCFVFARKKKSAELDERKVLIIIRGIENHFDTQKNEKSHSLSLAHLLARFANHRNQPNITNITIVIYYNRNWKLFLSNCGYASSIMTVCEWECSKIVEVSTLYNSIKWSVIARKECLKYMRPAWKKKRCQNYHQMGIRNT